MSIRNAFFRLNQTSGLFGRWLSLGYFLGIIIGPVGFLIISLTEDHRIPWYVVLLAFLLLLSSIGFGISRFRQGDIEADDLSIRPDKQ